MQDKDNLLQDLSSFYDNYWDKLAKTINDYEEKIKLLQSQLNSLETTNKILNKQLEDVNNELKNIKGKLQEYTCK